MYIPKKKKNILEIIMSGLFHTQTNHPFSVFLKNSKFSFQKITNLHGFWTDNTSNGFVLSTNNLFLTSKTTFFPNNFLHVFYDFLRKRTQLYPKWSKCIHIPFIMLQSEVCTKRFINISSNIEINTANTYQSFWSNIFLMILMKKNDLAENKWMKCI